MAGGFCPKCGKPVEAGWAHCAACGAALGAPGAVAGPPPSPSRMPSIPTGPPLWTGPPTGYWQGVQDEKKVDRTKTGLLLMVGAQLLSWIPLISYIGSLLAIIGVILILLGRTAFGRRHGTYAILSLVVYLAGSVLAGILAGVAGFSIGVMIGQRQTGPAAADLARGALGALVDATVFASIMVGIAHVLLTFALQDRTGRPVLIGGAVAYVIVYLYAAVVLWPPAIDAVAAAASGGALSVTSFGQLLAGVGTDSQLLTVVPASLFGLAYFLAWRRIDRGEIPARGSPVTAPPSPPAAP